MTESIQLLGIPEIQERVREIVRVSIDIAEIPEVDRKKLTIGTTIENDIARNVVYIPGARPDLGIIVAVYDVNRRNGRLTKVCHDECF